MKSFEDFLNEKRISTSSIKRELINNPKLSEALFDEEHDTMRELLEDGANPDFGSAEDIDSIVASPIFLAIKYNDTKAFDLLVEFGANIEYKNTKGNTPLQYACIRKDRENMVRKLCSLGADVDSISNDGMTPLESLAFRLTQTPIRDIVLQDHMRTNMVTLIQNKAKCSQKFLNSMEIAKINLRSEFKDQGYEDILKHYCKSSITEKRVSNTSVKQKMESPELDDSVQNEDYSKLQDLLNMGANPDSISKRYRQGGSVLFLAIKYGDSKAVKMLIESGADIEFKDERGYTPLMYMCLASDERELILKYLLREGADVNVVDEKGRGILENIVDIVSELDFRDLPLIDLYADKLILLSEYGLKCDKTICAQVQAKVQSSTGDISMHNAVKKFTEIVNKICKGCSK